MSRKLNSLLVLFAFAILVIAASSVMAQGPPLGCCKCLGEPRNTVDLSTISSNKWTVNGGSPVVFLSPTQINSAWNINPGPAQWGSTSASLGNGLGGDSVYELPFVVPNCTIPRTVTITGNFGGDNNVDVYLESTSGPHIGSCTGGWCFNTPHNSLPALSATAVSGPPNHKLIVLVHNISGPTGMFINAHLTGVCATK